MGERTIVIGGGVAGAAAAYWLSRDPRVHGEVVLLEAGARLGAHSSGRSAAILRPAVADPVTRALALETLEWYEREGAAVAGRDLLDPVGLVVAEGAAPDAPPAPWSAALEELGVARPLAPEERAARVPHFAPVGARAWELARCGRVAAHALLQALTLRAERDGARVETGAPVARVAHDGRRVTGVELADGRSLAADTVVLAAGAWAGALGAAAGCPLPLAASTRHLFVVPSPPGFDPRAPIVWDDALGYYARAYDGGLLVCACDQVPADPDAVAPRYLVDGEVGARARALTARAIVGGEGATPLALDRGWRGLRDQTPDDRPALGPDPRLAGLAWCAGLGGHGLSVGVAAGRALADLLAGRDAGEAAEAAVERFTPVTSAH